VTTPRWDDDQCLLDDLTQAWREVAPTAAALTTRAQAAYSWRTVDAELLLASLNFDSAVEVTSTRSAGAGGEGPRLLVFSSSPLSMELEVLPDQLVGQLVPPGAADIVVETEAGTSLRVSSDERGFFLVTPLPDSPMRLRCDTPTGRLVTDWVHL
jgi:hypothetical protein